MDRESMTRLRLDRRLIRRRSWISEKELDAELAKLPDVSDKVAPGEEATEDSGAGEPPAAPHPQ